MLGTTPTSPTLLAALGRLATAIDTAFPKVDVQPHAVWFRYVDLGLSLGFRPIDEYVPKNREAIENLDMKRLILAEVVLYNSHRLQQDPAFPFLPLTIPPPPSLRSGNSTPSLSRSNSVSSQTSSRSGYSAHSAQSYHSVQNPFGSSSLTPITSTIGNDEQQPVVKNSIELTEITKLGDFIKCFGEFDESTEDKTPTKVHKASSTQVVKVWPHVNIKAQFAAPPDSNKERQNESRWLLVRISDEIGFPDAPLTP